MENEYYLVGITDRGGYLTRPVHHEHGSCGHVRLVAEWYSQYFNRGTYAINVQWYTQKVIGMLEYVVEGGANAKPVVQRSNSTLLYAVPDEHINQVLGSRVRAPRQRTIRSNRMDDFDYSSARSNLQTTEGDWFRREFGNVWRLNESVRDMAIERIGQWFS